MIKIFRKDIDEIMTWHFDGFCHKGKLLDRLREQVRKCSRRNSRHRQHKEFISYLLDNIERIIKGEPEELSDLIDEIETQFKPRLYHQTQGNRGASRRVPTALGNILKDIFDYDKFCNYKNDNWNAYRLAEKLNVLTCPYCNRQFTHTLTDDRKTNENDRRIVRPDFDHFFDKATYRYLAVSFFNLIPSCQICNSRLKHSKFFSTKTHLHPYLNGFGDLVKFQIEVDDVSFFHGAVDKCKISFREKLTQSKPEGEIITKARKSIEDLRLTEQYQEHKDYAYEVISKALIYNTDYLDSLYKEYEGSIFKDKYDLLRFVTSNYVDPEAHSLRPLSKLTSDLVDQFELWDSGLE